jgi:hypothetical protein
MDLITTSLLNEFSHMGAEDLDRAIHEAVLKLNVERNRHPLPNQRIAA